MAQVNAAAPAPGPARDERVLRTSPLRSVLTRPEIGAAFGTVAIWIYFAIVAGDSGFLRLGGTATYLEVGAELGILAVAVALLMIGGEFDLSIGSIIGASGMIMALLAVEYGWTLWLAALAALGFALVVGFINGAIVVRTGLPSFIVTLATLFIIRGAIIGTTRLITGRTNLGDVDETVGYDIARRIFATRFEISTDFFGMRSEVDTGSFPISILWWLGLAALATWVLLRTRFGNWIFGAGGSPQAARNVGVPVNRVKIILFMTTAFAAWLVAMIQVITFSGADVLRGQGQEFYAIIAVVIGGTLLTGGYGSAIGAVFGALIFGMVRQGIVFAGVDADWFQVFLGAMLLIAVLINRFVRGRATESRR
ncbi:MAG: ABC transporter permease [Chloroflexia bacterium]|nr:ABC transporter permease [Chloroflexia bacterium]